MVSLEMNDLRSSSTESRSQQLPMIIVVMGVSGCGKSTLAKQLAEHLQLQFLDADDFHSSANKAHMQHGKPLTDDMRQPWVESIRNHLVQEVQQGHSCALAFSGLRKAHRNLIRIPNANVIFLHLHGEKQIIHDRMTARAEHFMPASLIDSQYAALELPTHDESIFRLDIQLPVAALIEQSLMILDRQSTFHRLDSKR